jgi:hypothetical protein
MLSAGQGLCYPVGWVRRVGRHEGRVQLGQLRTPPPSQRRGKSEYRALSVCIYEINPQNKGK